MADLDVQQSSISGIAPVFVAADAAGDTFTNYGNVLLHYDNQDATAKQVTISSNPCNFGETHDIVVSIPAGEERIIGAFSRDRFDDENYKVSVSYDDVVSLTVAVIQY